MANQSTPVDYSSVNNSLYSTVTIDNDTVYLNSSNFPDSQHGLLGNQTNSSQTVPEPYFFEWMLPGEVAVISIIFSISCSLALLGNVSAIYVFAKGRRCRSDVNGFLINLAVADLIMSFVCVPFTVAHVLLDNWIFGLPLCKIISWLQFTSVAVSTYTNACISVDRFIAVMYPFKKFNKKKCSTPLILASIWIAALGIAVVQLVKANLVSGEQDRQYCIEVWTDQTMQDAYFIFIFVSHYVIPVSLIVVMYSLVCKTLWGQKAKRVRRSIRGRNSESQATNKKKHMGKSILIVLVYVGGVYWLRLIATQLFDINFPKYYITKMLIVIMIFFILSWLPQYIFFFIYKFSTILTNASRKTVDALYYTTYFLAMSNSSQNPIIYFFMHENFRVDLAEAFVRLFPCCIKYKPFRVYLIRKLPRNSSIRKKNSLDRKLSCYLDDQSEMSQSLYRKRSTLRDRSTGSFHTTTTDVDTVSLLSRNLSRMDSTPKAWANQVEITP